MSFTGNWNTATIAAWCRHCFGVTNQTDGVCHSCNERAAT